MILLLVWILFFVPPSRVTCGNGGGSPFFLRREAQSPRTERRFCTQKDRQERSPRPWSKVDGSEGFLRRKQLNFFFKLEKKYSDHDSFGRTSGQQFCPKYVVAATVFVLTSTPKNLYSRFSPSWFLLHTHPVQTHGLLATSNKHCLSGANVIKSSLRQFPPPNKHTHTIFTSAASYQ